MSGLKNFETLYSLCKRRGYIFQSSEIYGGLNACWDYGPLGVQLKRNLSELWWRSMVHRQDIVGLDSSILTHEKTLQASGHVSSFTDPLSDCKICKFRFRPENKNKKCPKCGSEETTEERPFNLMFKTHIGSLEEKGSVVYLRPETAQGIYTNFLNIQSSSRKKLPFGVAQIGKAFRNEITPGPFIFRTREFEQMEMQYFIFPETRSEWFEYWKEKRFSFYKELNFQNIRFHPHSKDELAHYAHSAADIEYQFPIGWKEVEGVHDRGSYDLTQHQKTSKKSLEYTDSNGKKTLPYVIETSAGLDRLWLALLCASYKEEKVQDESRVVLALPKNLSPINIAVLPLSKKDHLKALSMKIRDSLSVNYRTDYDDAGSIGKRYRRQDEAGTPFAVTVDFESEKDQKVTIRERDSMKQTRIPIGNIHQYLKDNF